MHLKYEDFIEPLIRKDANRSSAGKFAIKYNLPEYKVKYVLYRKPKLQKEPQD